jgi:hypothetical protein
MRRKVLSLLCALRIAEISLSACPVVQFKENGRRRASVIGVLLV